MTSVIAETMRNHTAPPVEVGAGKLVPVGRKFSAHNRAVSRCFRLSTIVTVTGADALPVRSLFSDLASATSQNIGYFDRGLRDTHVGSDTRLLDPVSNVRAAYQRRIAQLRLFAEEDGIELSILSESDFFDFACTEPRIKAASLVLLDNGNLRAVWRSGQQEVGVQFYGGGSVQYLISREGDDGKITHTARRGTFEELSAAITDAELGRFVYE